MFIWICSYFSWCKISIESLTTKVVHSFLSLCVAWRGALMSDEMVKYEIWTTRMWKCSGCSGDNEIYNRWLTNYPIVWYFAYCHSLKHREIFPYFQLIYAKSICVVIVSELLMFIVIATIAILNSFIPFIVHFTCENSFHFPAWQLGVISKRITITHLYSSYEWILTIRPGCDQQNMWAFRHQATNSFKVY